MKKDSSPITLADDRLLRGFSCNETDQLLQHVLKVVFCRLRLPEENTHPPFNATASVVNWNKLLLDYKTIQTAESFTFLTFAWAPPSHPPFLYFLERKAEPSNRVDALLRLQRNQLAEFMAITFVVNGGERASLVQFRSSRRAHREPRWHREARSGQAQRDVARCEEIVCLQVRNGRPLGRISMQHPLDEGGCSWVDVLQRKL